MADFPLKQEAQEVQNIISGAVLFNKGTSLTEAEKAQARDNIGASSFGEGIKIFSHFDTLEELEAAIPEPNPGEAYSVGTEHPYSLYAYDFLNKLWTNYGFIRAADIAARMVQNAAVSVSAWEENLEVFEDYIFKAKIPLGEINGNDFAIVAFSPEDAVGGNFCPVCFAFDGYVEVWAKTIPTADIIIPAVTFIILDTEGGATGSSTKGITNASGGIATGGIDTSKLADGSVTAAKVADKAVTRNKLADDALYSPIMGSASGDYALTVANLGETIRGSHNTGFNVIVTADASAAIPYGAEFAIFRYCSETGGEVTVTFDGVNVCATGWDSYKTSPVIKIVDSYSMIAIKKVTTANMWLVTGNVEVVE